MIKGSTAPRSCIWLRYEQFKLQLLQRLLWAHPACFQCAQMSDSNSIICKVLARSCIRSSENWIWCVVVQDRAVDVESIALLDDTYKMRESSSCTIAYIHTSMLIAKRHLDRKGIFELLLARVDLPMRMSENSTRNGFSPYSAHIASIT